MCNLRSRICSLLLILPLCIGLSESHAQSAGYLPTGEFPKTDFDKSSIEIGRILSGGPPRDGIPAIDKPLFVGFDEATKWLDADEPVISYFDGSDARAYPLQILMFHEIVNDTVNGNAVAVTFCPLCNASIVFERRVDNTVLDFGTTGRLYNSDLIMYDRQTETWWQQFTGKGVIGEHNGRALIMRSSQIVSFATFKAHFPQGKVLSRKTGFNRPYGRNPYKGYDNINSNPFLFDGELDNRLPPMERVIGIRNVEKNSSVLVPLSALSEKPVHNLSVDGIEAVIFSSSKVRSALDNELIKESKLIPSAAVFNSTVDGQALTFEFKNGVIYDTQTRSEWSIFGKASAGILKNQQLTQLDGGVHFAFAWLAFDSDAVIYTP